MTRRVGPPAAGFGFVETLVALAVLGVTLLLSLAIVVQEPLVAQRLAARRAAVAFLAHRHEALRSGAMPRSGSETIDAEDLRRDGAPAAMSAATLVTEVTPRPRAGLCAVRLSVRYVLAAQLLESDLETLVYRPGSRCR